MQLVSTELGGVWEALWAPQQGLSDHQKIFCTRKTKKEKVGIHKHISFRSFKNYSVDEYEKALGQVIFPNYEQ